MAVQALITPETQIKVSSTLDKSVGKKHLVDGSPETCWTSQQRTTISGSSSIHPTHVSFACPTDKDPSDIPGWFCRHTVFHKSRIRGTRSEDNLS
ncbi:hypothetical protein DL96DRAFT_23681 [Flagelloscypha sp. PMI_526]|nr:hypothetical protein DL96DRAFT_23681 [Flagelloscypha sp. PMI_526]